MSAAGGTDIEQPGSPDPARREPPRHWSADVLLLDLALQSGRGEDVLAVLNGRERPVRVVVFSAYGGAPADLLAALAGLIFTARLNLAGPKAGDGFELEAISAAFIGGAAVQGGVGTIGGAIIGGLIIGGVVGLIGGLIIGGVVGLIIGLIVGLRRGVVIACLFDGFGRGVVIACLFGGFGRGVVIARFFGNLCRGTRGTGRGGGRLGRGRRGGEVDRGQASGEE